MNMKRLSSACLAGVLMFGLAGTVRADDRPYYRTYDDGGLYMGNSITPDTYPQPCITSGYISTILSGYAEPLYMTFTPPENAYPREFDSNSCYYLDTTQGIQYMYYLEESDAYETFLADCSSDEYILADGSDGYAAYVEPGDSYYINAYALIAAEDFGKSAKLYVRLVYSSDPGDSEESRRAIAEEGIEKEVSRIMGSMSSELLDVPFWATDYFAGIKIPSTQVSNQMLVVTFPELEGDYQTIVEDGTDSRVRGEFYYPEEDNSIEFELEMDESTSYVAYLAEEEPDSCFTQTFGDYELNIRVDLSSEYATRVNADLLTDGDAEDGNFFSMSFYDTRTDHWTSTDEVVAFLEQFMAGVSLTEADADPYVPGENAYVTPDVTESAEEAETWICPECEAENEGNFCGNCGAAKP